MKDARLFLYNYLGVYFVLISINIQSLKGLILCAWLSGENT